MEEQKSQDPHRFNQTCLSPEGIYTIPEGVTEIAEYGLSRQEGIKSIEIPGSVKRIGIGAFDRCKNLKPFYGSGLESINICKTFEFYLYRN